MLLLESHLMSMGSLLLSLNKIGEERIRDLTSDILFPVTFKCPVRKPYKGKICWPKITITRFYDFDDNKIYVVICTNQVQVFKFISEF